jgi:hypothetical protein
MANFFTTSKLMIVLGTVFLLSSCDKEFGMDSTPEPLKQSSVNDTRSARKVKPDEGTESITASYVTYLIKAGGHSSTNSGYKSLRTASMKFEALFDASAIYQSKLASNQADINKLYGMADCGSLHQTNSARFGWRWYNNQLEILAYVYVNKVWSYKFISAVEIGKPYTYELLLQDKQYVFSVNGQSVTMPRACTGTGSGYQLYPYFGGDEVAPHDVTIKIRNL